MPGVQMISKAIESNNCRPIIVGGASKSGTTALFYYLMQHPEICMSKKKELHFFAREYLAKEVGGPGDKFILAEIPRDFDEYLSHYDFNGENVFFDISPSYLYHYKCADNISSVFPNAKLIFILRNPVDKVYSQYLHLVGAGREPLSFSDALEEEEKRKSIGFADMWLYKESGFYFEAASYFVNVFGRDNVLFFYHEELISNPDVVLEKICEFSGVDPSFKFEPVVEANKSGVPKSIILAKLLAPNAFTYFARRFLPKSLGRNIRKFLKSFNTGAKPNLSVDIRNRLSAVYQDDIHKLELLVGRKSGWVEDDS